MKYTSMPMAKLLTRNPEPCSTMLGGVRRAKREIKYLKRAAAEDRKLHAAEVEQKDRELNKARLGT